VPVSTMTGSLPRMTAGAGRNAIAISQVCYRCIECAGSRQESRSRLPDAGCTSSRAAVRRPTTRALYDEKTAVLWHGPVLHGDAIADAFERTRALAGMPRVQPPGQSLLDQILATMVAS
jgi:hypothetical protein